MAKQTTKDLKAAATYVREEDLADLDDLLKELKNRVHQARQDGRIYMMQQYTQLVAMISPEVTRLRKRFEREDLAAFRREHKQMKKAAEDDQDETKTP